MDELRALAVRAEADGAVARGERAAEVQRDGARVAARSLISVTHGHPQPGTGTYFMLRHLPNVASVRVSLLCRPQSPSRWEHRGNVSTRVRTLAAAPLLQGPELVASPGCRGPP